MTSFFELSREIEKLAAEAAPTKAAKAGVP
jgi:hypothetical protein